jgi:hypothetical protein
VLFAARGVEFAAIGPDLTRVANLCALTAIEFC